MPLAVSLEVAESVRQRCRDFLGGPWASAESADIKVEALSGCANSNFAATLTTNIEHSVVSRKVTIHLYGNAIFGTEGALKYNGEAAESVIAELLSQKSLAPAILGVFPGGRIEEFIPSRHMKLFDFQDRTLIFELARKIARFHACDAPIRKIPDRLEVMMQQVTKRVMPVDFGDAPESDKVHYYNFLNFPLREEVTRVSKIMSKIGGEPVFCHGDLNLTNVLLRDGATEEDSRIILVDFELCCYFYRAYDFAHHFHFRKLIPKRVSEHVVKVEHLDDANLARDRELMVEEYLKEWARLRNGQTCAQDTIEHLNMEIDFAQLAVILVYICFTRLAVMTRTDPLRFKDYWKMCEEYFAKKKHALDKYGDPSLNQWKDATF